MQELNTLAKQIHENAKAKGFWDKPRNTGEVFMLIVSELGEAQEAHRSDKWASLEAYELYKVDNMQDTAAFKHHIKGSLEEEIADVVIRVLDWCHFSKIQANPFYESELSENFSENLLSATKLICNAHGFEVNGFKTSLEYELNRSLGLMFKIAEANNFDLMRHIELKMQYNATRERLHGKKY